MASKQDKPYSVDLKIIKNTDKFREAAIFFEQNGYYVSAPPGTTMYYEYWDREVNRCLNGFTSKDGDYITGYNYFYLNYSPILRVADNKKGIKSGKIFAFPKYWDYDREFFLAVEEAEKTGKHLTVLKARRKGYSYKVASMLTRNFYLIPDSKNYAIAGEMEFLTKDGILSKTWDMFDFIDENTAWFKKRQKVDRQIHKRASYIFDKDGVQIEAGYKSEVMGISLKNDANKIRGKAGRLMIFEEAGKFPNLKEAWMVAKHSVEQGDDVFGLMIAFGTGGTDEGDYEGLRDLFYEPAAYGCLEVENKWDDGAVDPCGFFVPVYYNFSENYMDKDGNSNKEGAMNFCFAERKRIVESATDRHTIDRYIAEMPMNPQEATLQLSGNIFPKEELIKHLSFLRTHKAIRNQKQVGNLVTDENGIITWKQSSKPKDLIKYRIEKGTDLSGEVVIWEHPTDNPPYGLYVGGCDPYDHDQSTTNSLGSIFIYKRFQGFESYYDIIVAEYTGRPETAEDYYENVYKLLKYYNAVLLYENERKGIFQHFVKKNAEYLLADQPDIINDIIQNSTVQRRKGIHMTQQIKAWAEIKVKEFLLEDRGEGRLGLHTILSEPLIEELISYNDKGNFDRVIAFMMVLIYREELHKVHVKQKQEHTKSQSLFPQGIFKETTYFNL